MKVYKPIDGLLPARRTSKKWVWWVAIPGAALVAFILHVTAASEDISRERQELAAQRAREDDAYRLAAMRIEAAREEGVQAQANPDSASGSAPSTDSAGAAEETVETTPVAGSASDSNDDPAVDVEKINAGRSGKIRGELAGGQTLYTALSIRGFSAANITPAINSMAKVFNFRRSRKGDDFSARYNSSGEILELRYQRSIEVVYSAKRTSKGKYEAKELREPVKTTVVSVGGTVKSTVRRAITDLGESNRLASRFINIFTYDVDFGNVTKPGDTFRIVVEKLYVKGQFVRYGRVLAAEYKHGEKTHRAYASHKDGDSAYYDGRGKSLKRMFLRNPVKGSKMTSGFGPRMHPVLKKEKLHNGVDYAAPTGTPINPIADGKVVFAGEKGANGNLVAIEHADGWTSYYAHLSRFGAKAKTGKQIKQSDVLGYVGSTGRSTGPHLHLGVKKAGKFVDFMKIQSTRSPGLRGKELQAFKRWVKEQDAKLDACKIKKA